MWTAERELDLGGMDRRRGVRPGDVNRRMELDLGSVNPRKGVDLGGMNHMGCEPQDKMKGWIF